MTTPTDVLDVARSQLGVIETGGAGNDSGNVVPYWDWWDGITGQHDQGQSWCGCFVSWCFDRAEMRLTIGNLPGYVYCPYGEAWFRGQGRLTDASHAKQGDVAFFHFPNEPDEANHTGIIESVDAAHQTIVSIEGNTTAGMSGSQSNGGGVYRRTRSWMLVRSVGQPRYAPPEEDVPAGTKTVVVTCDPKTGHGYADVPGVPKGSVLACSCLAGDDGSVARAGISPHAALNGDAVVCADVGGPTLAPVKVTCFVAFNPS